MKSYLFHRYVLLGHCIECLIDYAVGAMADHAGFFIATLEGIAGEAHDLEVLICVKG
jgi:hypothetical protein